MHKDVFTRLLAEAKELQGKVDALDAFLKSNKKLELSEENQYLLDAQLQFMKGYLFTLRRRININKHLVEGGSVSFPYFMVKFEIPLYVVKNKKGEKWWLNLNNYRNTHYQTLNSVKKKFKETITPTVCSLSTILKPIKITYIVYPPTKRLFDMDNMCILSKFTGDAIVELNRMEDDNYLWIPEVSFKFGSVDKDNPRCEVIIEEIS